MKTITVEKYRVAESAEELAAIEAATPEELRPRVALLRLLKEGAVRRPTEAAPILDVPGRTLRHWWQIYHGCGLARLLGHPTGQRGEPAWKKAYESGNGLPRFDGSVAVPAPLLRLLCSLPTVNYSLEWVTTFKEEFKVFLGDVDRVSVIFCPRSLPLEDSNDPFFYGCSIFQMERVWRSW